MSTSRYEIRDKIGAGGLGAVFKAFDTQLQRDVAVKRVLTTEHGSQEEVDIAAKKLLEEAQTLSSLNHPNIVTVFDVGQDEKGGFVVMELLKGETLDDTVARGVLTQDDFIEVVHQTQEALIAAQALNILHRDLKPTNVMVIWQASGRFQTKILDFGLAKFSKSPSVQTMDQEDAVMGSIYFMAPEQFERGELDVRTDLYQIGCVYYHALTGKYPFDGETAPQVMNAHLKNRYTPLDKLRPDLSPAICKWVHWLIARNMEDRPDNAKAAIQGFPTDPDVMPPALENALGGEVLPVAQAIDTSTGTVTTHQTSGVQIVVPPPMATPPSGLVATATSSQVHVHTAGVRTATGPMLGSTTGPLTGAIQPPIKKPVNKMMVILLSVLSATLIGIVGALFISKSIRKGEIQRLEELASVENKNPSGTSEDIDLAVKYLSSREASASQKANARKVLTVIEGGGIDSKLINVLSTTDQKFVRLLVSNALAERGVSEAVPAMMNAFKEAESPAQKNDILNSVRRVATEKDVEAMLDYLEGNHDPAARKLFEEIILAIFRHSKNTNQFTEPLLKRVSTSQGAERQSLFRILGALGSPKTLTRLQGIYNSNDNPDYQLDAIVALLNWPDQRPMGLLEQIYQSKDVNTTLKQVAGLAYVRLANLPSLQPIGKRIEQWKKALEWATDGRSQQNTFVVMADYPSQQTLNLAKSYANDPKLGRLSTLAIDRIQQRLKETKPLGNGVLAASEDAIRGDSAMYINDRRMLGNWSSPDTYFVWFTKTGNAGAYNVEIELSDPFPNGSELEVIIGKSLAKGTSLTTSSLDETKTVKLNGKVQLEAGTVTPVFLRANGVVQANLPSIVNVKLSK